MYMYIYVGILVAVDRAGHNVHVGQEVQVHVLVGCVYYTCTGTYVVGINFSNDSRLHKWRMMRMYMYVSTGTCRWIAVRIGEDQERERT